MNIGSLKITAKQGAGILDIPGLLQSADFSTTNPKSHPNVLFKDRKQSR